VPPEISGHFPRFVTSLCAAIRLLATHTDCRKPWIEFVSRYQDLHLVAARRAQLQFDQIQAVALQALQNSVETANMAAKQAVRHSDIAIDAQWNPVQLGTADNLIGSVVEDTKVAAKAVDAATAKSVDATTSVLIATLTTMTNVLAAMTKKLGVEG
jgi:hypothetical protein